MLCNLKTKTEFSFGRAYAPLSRVIQRFTELGVQAAAMVDDDTWGHVKWYNACKAAGIIPLLGCSAIVSEQDDLTPRMWFIAKNKEGLSELYTVLSRSYHQKIPTKVGSFPRLFYQDVLGMSDNIFKFAGDVVNESFLTELYHNSKESFKLDIVENGSALINRVKLNLATKLGCDIIGVRDNFYAYPEDANMLDYLPFGAKSTKDMSIQLPTSYQDATNEIVEACKDLELPFAPMIHMEGDLEALCRAAIPERFPNGWLPEYEARLQHELSEIKAKNFESYFLLVNDMVVFAKKHMLVGPSRGSAAGSLVCYLAHITEIDPLPPKLYFERFIDKTRKDLPDIDLDFPDDKRELVIDYLIEKWGAEHVAHVGNIASFQPKSALIQVCKKLNIDSIATAAVKEAIIERGKADARAQFCLLDTLKDTDAGKKFLKMYPEVIAATNLEGHAVRTGIHAAGILVCNDEITKYCVVDDKNVAHIDKLNIEQVNLLKMDILGLRTLSVLEDAQIGDVDWYHLPINDALTFDIFNKRKLSGIFQFEGKSMRSISAEIEFSSIKEIDAVTAIARPGPFNSGVSYQWIDRHNGKPYQSVHPVLAKILKDTYELPLYQEDTMAIVREIGNFTWEQTSFVRKAISKSQGSSALKVLTETFLSGAAANGFDASTAQSIWNQINTMGAWQMNKAHTYSYATISYWTAWLKAHYPLQFAATTLRHAKDEESAINILRELVDEGYHYVWFDPNLSNVDWDVIDGKLIGGFKSIKGVGENKAAELVERRNRNELTQSEVDKLVEQGSAFKDVYHISNKYADYYAGKANVRGKVSYIKDIPEGLPDGAERVYIGELIYKNQRDLNEDALVKRRGGKVIPPSVPTKFLHMVIRDDTDEMKCRVNARDYERMGRTLCEDIPIGSILLIRAKFFHGIRYGFITKWRLLH